MLIIYLVIALLIAVYAATQQRSFLLWFLVSVVFTPFMGLILLIAANYLDAKAR